MGLSGWNLLPETPAALDAAISRVVRKAAFDIQARAMDNAPNDTGFLESSIYVSMHSSSGYASAAATAAGRNPTAVMEPEVTPPTNDRTAYIVVGATYGIYVELGTMYMAAQPYLLPAAELVKPQYLAALSGLDGTLLSLLGGGGAVTTSVSDITADEEPI